MQSQRRTGRPGSRDPPQIRIDENISPAVLDKDVQPAAPAGPAAAGAAVPAWLYNPSSMVRFSGSPIVDADGYGAIRLRGDGGPQYHIGLGGRSAAGSSHKYLQLHFIAVKYK